MSVRYTITALIEDAGDAEKYLHWLQTGHVQDIKACGALSVEIVKLDPDFDSSTIRVESSYVFSSRDALQQYLDGPAIALRKEGQAKFGHIKRERRIGDIIFSL